MELFIKEYSGWKGVGTLPTKENIAKLTEKILNLEDAIYNENLTRSEQIEFGNEIMRCVEIKVKLMTKQFTGHGLGGEYQKYE